MSMSIATALKGAAMGVAEAIPGVSGGTIAFITGIYERLIAAIKAFDFEAVRLLLGFRLKELWEKIDGGFLASLLIGMVIGIGVSIFTITELLKVYPEYLWGFFFGLILASAIYIARTIKSWNLLKLVLLLVGIAIALLICRMSPVSGSENLIYIFACGAIAISALILPGVSGSFMLLILGMYTTVLGSVRGLLEDFQMAYLQVVIVFALGCLIGLILFSRVISWAYAKYEDELLALMTGFIIGSLYKIWPWRNPLSLMTDDGEAINVPDGISHAQLEDYKILQEQLVTPGDYFLTGISTPAVMGCMVLGAGLVWLLGRRSS